MPPECAVRAQNERLGAQFKLPGAIGRKALLLLGLLVGLSVQDYELGWIVEGFGRGMSGWMSGYSASCPPTLCHAPLLRLGVQRGS